MGSRTSSPQLSGTNLIHREQGRAPLLSNRPVQILAFPSTMEAWICAMKDKEYTSCSRRIGSAEKQFGLTVYRGHIHSSRALASPPQRYFFSIYYFQDLASASGTRHHCGQVSKSALDHGPSWLTRQEGASAPWRQLSGSLIHYMFTPVSSLGFSQCPSHPSCQSLNFSYCVSNVKPS